MNAADEDTSLHEKIKKKEKKNKKNKKDENDDNYAHKNALNLAFKKSIITNKWFYLTLIICFYMFKSRDTARTSSSSSSSSYLGLAFSFFFVLVFGHITHRLSHNIDFTKVYNKHKNGNMNGYIDSILTSVFRFMDFHSVTHHDSSINKQPANVCYEFMNNFFTQGGGLVLFVWFCNRCIDMRIILLWALMYATAHNINYLFLKPTVHRDHHLHEDTNYGLDIADIIFDTKYDLSDIEDYNHISINLIVITAIMVLRWQ
jgi:hypothetical protein